MRDKLSTALALLKKVSGLRGYLYEPQWCAIIGPTDAGKTTVLLNAGLSFSLAAKVGIALSPALAARACARGGSPERSPDRHPGRYTTQDSDGVVDKAGWLRIPTARLICSARKRCGTTYSACARETRPAAPSRPITACVSSTSTRSAAPGSCSGGKRIASPRQKQLPDALSDDQVRRLLSSIRNPTHKTCLAVMYACGLRISEATALEIGAVDRGQPGVAYRRQGRQGAALAAATAGSR
jgi:hypothetical protein